MSATAKEIADLKTRIAKLEATANKSNFSAGLSGVDKAAHDYIKDMETRKDGTIDDVYPFWHGWAIREAFLEGAKFASRLERKAT